MATQTVTYDELNPIGNVTEDYGRWTSDDTTGEVQTRLAWIYYVEIMSPGAALQVVSVHPNSKSDGADDDTDDAGWFHYGDSANTEALRYRAVGKGK